MAQRPAINTTSCLVLTILTVSAMLWSPAAIAQTQKNAPTDAVDTMISCSNRDMIYRDGRCIPIEKYATATEKNLAEIIAREKQDDLMICAGVKDPCSMPICNKPNVKCPDKLKDIQKLIPPMNIPKPTVSNPNVNNGLGTLTDMRPVTPATPGTPTQPVIPNGGLTSNGAPTATTTTNTIKPYTPPTQAIAPVTIQQPVAVQPGTSPNQATGQTNSAATPRTAPAGTAPTADPNSAGGLPSWLRFGK